MTEPNTDPNAARAARALHEGPAVGGPLDGHPLVSRFPLGVLAVDRSSGRAWIYDYQATGEGADARFTCRDAAGVELDDDKRFTTADGAAYDVVAVG